MAEQSIDLLHNEIQGNSICGVDVSEWSSIIDKANGLRTDDVKSVQQHRQLNNPDARIVLDEIAQGDLLSTIANYGKGSTTGDKPRFLVGFWELQYLQQKNVRWLDSPSSGEPWSGRQQVTTVALNDPLLTNQLGCWLRGQSVWGKKGVAVNKMRSLEPFLYGGEVFDDNICPIAPEITQSIAPLFSYVSSPDYAENVRVVDQKLNVTAATLTKVPFDLSSWEKISEQQYPNGLPQPYINDPTQWIFHGHPCGSVIWEEEKSGQ